jgi:hypothetical protein
MQSLAQKLEVFDLLIWIHLMFYDYDAKVQSSEWILSKITQTLIEYSPFFFSFEYDDKNQIIHIRNSEF